MKLQAGIAYAGLWIPLFLALALASAYLIYFFKNKTDGFSKVQMWTLATTRFISLFIISFFLISPLIETIKKRKEKPMLIVGIDQSTSMLETMKQEELISKYINPIIEKASSNYDINLVGFGDGVKNIDTISFSDKRSNYSAFFDEIDDRYYSLNVGAMVIIGDGIFNEGNNPQHVGSNFNFPIYTLGLGDTTSFSDQSILSVIYNPNVFLGNSFPLEMAFNFSEFPLKWAKLEISSQGSILHSDTIEVPQSNFYTRRTVVLNAKKPGMQTYEVKLTPFERERNQQNNRFKLTIEVHQNKQKILILSQGPHPDNGAIAEALKKQANFEIQTKDLNNFDGDFSAYNLIVLNQLPSAQSQQNPIFGDLAKSKKPLLIIAGPNTSVAAFNNMQTGITLKTSNLLEEVKPTFNDAFTRFGFPQLLNETSTIYPPLLTYLADINLSETADILATQNINGIPMKSPLIVTTLENNRKIGAILGEGIWRWRLKEYQDYGHQDTFDQLIINLVTYLGLTQDREQFRVQYDKIYSETTPIRIKAQVFNDVYEPVVTNEIKLVLTDSTGTQFDYIFDKLGEGYFLNMGYLKPGTYNFEASTILGDKTFSKNGDFSIQKVILEQQNTRANHAVLSKISHNSGGRFYTPLQIDNLIENLNQKENQIVKIHREKKISELIDWKWIFLILIFLLSLEWFLRKYWGNY